MIFSGDGEQTKQLLTRPAVVDRLMISEIFAVMETIEDSNHVLYLELEIKESNKSEPP